MGFLMDSWVTEAGLLVVTLLVLFYRHHNNLCNYFRSCGIPYKTPIPLIGDTAPFTMTQAEQSLALYNCFPGERFFGYYQFSKPTLLIKDPKLIQDILVKDFTHFHDRGFPIVEGDVLFNETLVHLKGERWRNLRHKLTPTFSSGKLKMMFEQLVKSGDHLLENIEENYGQPFDAKFLSAGFTSEVIASTAFGIDFSKDNPQSVDFVKRVTSVLKSQIELLWLFIMIALVPKVAAFFKMSFLTRGTKEYFVNLAKSTREYRQRNNIKRSDYFGLLMELQEAEKSGKSGFVEKTDNEDDALINQMQYAPENQGKAYEKMLTNEVFTAQAFAFLLGGSDTVSGTLSWALYHIARDPVVQEQLIQEVDAMIDKHKGFTYEGLKELEYMDQVLQETLRFYPIFSTTVRQCTQPYHIPGTDVVLEKGFCVAIPVMGLHMDPQVYPDPERFDPNRFIGNNHKPNYAYLPFGDGPRICIGMRFAIVEMKLYLSKVFSRYSVKLSSKTRQPITMDRNSFFPKAAGGIWIDFKRRL